MFREIPGRIPGEAEARRSYSVQAVLSKAINTSDDKKKISEEEEGTMREKARPVRTRSFTIQCREA